MTVNIFRMQRKSGLQLRASCSWHVLKPKINFSLASKTFWCAGLITQFLCDLNFSKNFTCPLSELRTEFTSPIEKSTSPGLSDTTFFARWVLQMWVLISCKDKGQHSQAVFPNGHYKWIVLLGQSWNLLSADFYHLGCKFTLMLIGDFSSQNPWAWAF